VRRLIRNAKAEEHKKLGENITADTTNSFLWKKIRSINGVSKPIKPVYINHNNITIENELEIANVFADKLEETFKSSNESTLKPQVHAKLNLSDSSLLNVDFNISELNLALRNAKNSSPGKDQIHYKMISTLFANEKQTILSFFNRIWRDGTSPKVWNESVILMLPKTRKNLDDIKNYRPIQLLVVFSKIFEKTIVNRLKHLIDKAKVLHSSQSGFRRRRTATDNLVALETVVRNSIQKRKEVLGIFFDIEKAYDTIDHRAIINIIDEIGIDGKMKIFIQNFLKNRTFQVKFGEKLSTARPQTKGVPQGSILSVLLFILVMNTISKYADIEHIFMFADDIVVLFELGDIDDNGKIQDLVDNLINWTETIGFRFNAEKSKLIKFSNKHKQQSTPIILMNGKKIEEVSSFKFLGVHVDSKLKFEDHVNYQVKLATNDLNIIKYLSRQKFNIRQDTLLNILNMKLRARLEYGAHILHNITKKNRSRIEAVYNAGLRVALGAFRSSPKASLYAEAGVLSLKDRRKSR